MGNNNYLYCKIGLQFKKNYFILEFVVKLFYYSVQKKLFTNNILFFFVKLFTYHKVISKQKIIIYCKDFFILIFF